MSNTKRADHICPGDVVDGRRVIFAIPNYLRVGETEVRFNSGSTEFYPNDVQVVFETSWEHSSQ